MSSALSFLPACEGAHLLIAQGVQNVCWPKIRAGPIKDLRQRLIPELFLQSRASYCVFPRNIYEVKPCAFTPPHWKITSGRPLMDRLTRNVVDLQDVVPYQLNVLSVRVS